MSDFLTSPAPSNIASLKIPPHSIEAEQAVIGGLLLDNRAWEKIADKITVADFYREEHRVLFSAIGNLEAKSQPFDAVTLSELLTNTNQLDQVGGLAYIGRLAKETPSAANITAYADIVRERSILRQLIATSLTDEKARNCSKALKCACSRSPSRKCAVAADSRTSRIC